MVRPDFDHDFEPPRLMTYSHDRFGLGHLRRSSNIAASLVRDMPRSNVLMLVGSSLGAFFELPTGVDFIKIPSIIKVDDAVYQPLGLRLGVEETRALRASMIREAVRAFKPYLFLVDALYPHELSTKALAERIMADLLRNDYPVRDPAVNLNGGRQAATRLQELARARAGKPIYQKASPMAASSAH